jgi:hypothetical protein
MICRALGTIETPATTGDISREAESSPKSHVVTEEYSGLVERSKVKGDGLHPFK